LNKNQKKIRLDDLPNLEARNKRQHSTINSWEDGKNLILNGSAGTGKTYLALSLALESVLDGETPYHDLIIIRSIVPTRDIGFLPGDEEEKKEAYTAPYKAIFQELFGCTTAWDNLKTKNQLHFESTSFIRGITYNHAVIVVDECQNLNYHELCSVITRIGKHCRIIFSGDYMQTDLVKLNDKEGINKFLKIINKMKKHFTTITFTSADIVRSGLVRDFIIAKNGE